MSKISSHLLTDTLSVVQLARETAMAGGKQAQASRLTSVANDLKNIVTTTRDTRPAVPYGELGQGDFRALLAAAAKKPEAATNAAAVTGTANVTATGAVSSTAAAERNRMVLAMAKSNMTDIDIARQLGMTRDEVRMVMNVSQKYQTETRPGMEVLK